MGPVLRQLIAPTAAVLRRSRASAGLVAATFVMTVTATSLVAAVPIYVDAIEQGGFRASLSQADTDDRAIDITVRTPSESATSRATDIDDTVRQALPGTVDGVTIAQTDSYGYPDTDPSDGTTITSLATISSSMDALQTVRGDRRASTPMGVVPVSLVVAAADALGIDVGDEVTLDGRDDPDIRVRVVAVVSLADPSAVPPGTPLGTGAREVGSFVETGPFLLESDVLTTVLQDASRPVTVRWRGLVRPSSLSTGDADATVAGIGALPGALDVDGERIDVTTTFGEAVLDAERAVDSTVAVVAVVLVQLVGLALYGVSLSAQILASSRTTQTTLLLSRGARTTQLGALAGVEALLIALPATLAAPFAADLAVRLVGRWGPMHVSGIELAPRPSLAALGLAALVAVVAIGVIVWPSLTARAHTGTGHRNARLQRGGVDVVIAVMAVVGVWALGRSPVASRDASGDLGVDPVLVLAPALGVLAAAVLTVRLVSVGARIGRRLAARSRGLASALASAELSRAGGRANRTAVLVMSTLAIGTYALSTGSTWERSVRDQADATVGADLVVTPLTAGPSAVDPAVLHPALVARPGVQAAVPLATLPMSTSRAGTVTAIATDVLALDDIARARTDLSRSSVSVEELRSASRPTLADLGGSGRTLSLDITLRGGREGDALGLTLVVADGIGSIHRIVMPDVTVAEGAQQLRRPLTTAVDGVDVAPTGPLSLVAVDTEVPVPLIGDTTATPLTVTIDDITIDDITIDDAAIDDTATGFVDGDLAVDDIPLTAATAQAPEVSAAVDDGRLTIEVDPGASVRTGTSVRTRVHPAAALDPPPIPALTTTALLDELGLRVGDRPQVRVNGTSMTLDIVGTIERVPFAAAEKSAVLVDWATLTDRLFTVAGRSDPPSQWALTIDTGASAAALDDTSAALERWAGDGVVDRRELAERLSQDPATIGVLGSLALAVAASLVITLIGLALTAVVGARERSMSYSVLRSMGAPSSELRRWLLLEMAPLVATAVVAGLTAGVLLARVTMDSVTLSRSGEATVPAPELVVPVGPVGALVVIAALASVVLPLAMARTLGRQRSADILRIGEGT